MNNTVENISPKSKKQLKINQISYTIEATLEYFIDILIKGAFLTAILINIGVTDSVVGIVSSLASLGFTAQLFSVLLIKPKGHVKRMVTVMHFINQLMFFVLYLIPYIQLPQIVKISAFAVMYLGGNLLHYTVFPFKLDWMMSYVPDKERGKFTANKEIVSLLTGMVFSFSMGSLIDYFKSVGKAEIGFVLSGVTIFILCVLHLVTLVIVKDPDEYKRTDYSANKHTIKSILDITLFDKKMGKIILLDVLWHIGTGISTAYFSIYAQKSMGITLTTITVITVMSNFSRALVSKFFGRMADKYSWANMMMVSFGIGALAFLVYSFGCPENCINLKVFGSAVTINVFYIGYMIIHAVYMAGSNSGMMNITFDYISHENRRYALGIKSAIGGLAGFLATLAAAPFVDYVQKSGNVLFGAKVYAQQILSFTTFIVFLFLMLYTKKVVMKMKKVEE